MSKLTGPAIESVRTPSDAFLCPHYGCVLRASHCLARQKRASGRGRGVVESRDALPFATCGKCAEGSAMRKRLEGGR